MPTLKSSPIPTFRSLFTAYLCLSLVTKTRFCFAITVRGAIQLDSLTFDKTISHYSYTLVKFDTAYPYGDKHDEFKKVALKAFTNPNLMIAECNINEYGDNENQDLGQRFNIDKETYPQYSIFLRNGERIIMPNTAEYWKEMDIIFFLRDNSVWIGMPFTTERMDQFAAIYMDRLTSKKDEEAEQVMETLDNFIEAGGAPDTPTDIAQVYLTIMEKILESSIANEGNTSKWYKAEAHRLQKIFQDKDKLKNITDDKKKNMKMRLNILYSFAKPARINDKLVDEIARTDNGARDEL